MKFKTEILYKTMLAATFIAATVMSSATMATEKQSGDFGRGAKAWVDNCGRCHNVRDPKELRDDQWISTAFHMRLRAGLTGQQTRDILTFLQGSN